MQRPDLGELEDLVSLRTDLFTVVFEGYVSREYIVNATPSIRVFFGLINKRGTIDDKPYLSFRADLRRLSNEEALERLPKEVRLFFIYHLDLLTQGE